MLIFHHQSHIWQNSGFRAMAKMLSANQLAGFFKFLYLKKVNDEVYFWLANKDRSILQVDTIILVMDSQTCPKVRSTQSLDIFAICPEKHSE